MEDGLRHGFCADLLTKDSLNPCCNGRWSPTIGQFFTPEELVLILVVMEDGLRREILHRKKTCGKAVLILVVMEDGLRPKEETTERISVLILVVMEDGLRLPRFERRVQRVYVRVLILVVMEDGLRLDSSKFIASSHGLNPCCNGRWSPTHGVCGYPHG